MVDDVAAFVTAVKKHRIKCSAVVDRGWGLLTEIVLPGGGSLGVYQPRHARPKPMKVERADRGADSGSRRSTRR